MPAFRASSIRPSPDLQRIVSLPRRTLRKSVAAKHAAAFTAELALVRGAELRPMQGQLLYEARKVGGLFGSLPVGMGKTLPLELLAVVFKSRRAVLIIPAALQKKTLADRRAFAGVWRLASPPPRIITREILHTDANAYLLDEINPDVILIDEADELANSEAATWVRIERFVQKKRAAGGFGAVRVVALTGTPTRKSILGYWHILRLCLGDMAPVPKDRREAETWAAAIDEKAPRKGFRPKPGPLGATLEEARAWYLDRLEHTPGVMLVDKDSAVDPATGKPIPLTIALRVAPECPDIDEAFDVLRTRWESPSGEPVTDALSLNRIDGQAGCGLYTYWKPPPPAEWIAARQTVAKFIRKRILDTRRSLKPLDTEAQVLRRHPAHPAVVEWRRVKKTFDPAKSSQVAWISDATVQWGVWWIRKHQKAGRICVVWSGSVEYGKRLAKAAGVPYYGDKGIDRKTGIDLDTASRAKVRTCMVCSWHANKRGFNLQDWRDHAIVMPPPSAKYLEQTIGRSHRAPKPGVAAHLTPVRVTILLTSGGTLDAFHAALREAEFAKLTAKSTQKILRAKIVGPPELPESLRWAVKDED
jgi:hypothetical protein